MPPKKDESLCVNCSKVVKEGIQCDICDLWWHANCAGIKSELCDYLGANQQLHWYCTNCNSGVGKMLKEVIKMQDQLKAVEEFVRKVEAKTVKLREDIHK